MICNLSKLETHFGLENVRVKCSRLHIILLNDEVKDNRLSLSFAFFQLEQHMYERKYRNIWLVQMT